VGNDESAGSYVTLHTDHFNIRIVNSDYFLNMQIAIIDKNILELGSKLVSLSENSAKCKLDAQLYTNHNDNVNVHTHDDSPVHELLAQQYPAIPLHGLVGQTWRNAQVCGHFYEGHVDDYMVSSLFGQQYTFNFFTPA